MGIWGGREGSLRQWWKKHRTVVPALGVLLTVLMLWGVGTAGGVRYLHDAPSPLAMLGGLYVMLVAVALTVIIVVAALNRVVSHFSYQESHQQPHRISQNEQPALSRLYDSMILPAVPDRRPRVGPETGQDHL